MPTLCLGEAIVDLVCEHPVADLAEADSFVPHLGGAVANVAVGAARCGAEVALAGGTGDDP
ncbi:MAG: fructokinase, partial [Solirubrobacteraceae bacterium]|nr:fructokinase [Solirubrobacteraceae bacterium]